MDRLDELRHRYADSLPQKGEDLAALWNAWQLAPEVRSNLLALHQQTHRLSGSAPAYGFDQIGELAQRVDAMLADWMAARGGERRGVNQLCLDLSGDMNALLAALKA